jgi:type I restriction enzyme M protein
MKDDGLEDSASLPEPDVIAAEIVEDMEVVLDEFAQMAADLKQR